MLNTVRTIGDLHRALKGNFKIVQHYQQQVTVEEDFHNYQRWLSDNEVTTEVLVRLKRSRARTLGVHPSSASKKGVCLRKLYYECANEVSPGVEAYDHKSQMTWDIGTALHDIHQKWLEDMYGDQFEKEVPLRDEALHIYSHTDGIFSFTHYRFILEMKSIKEGGNYGWEKVQAKPMEDNVRQAHFYMKLADVPYALIFYMNKNAGEFKEHAIIFNQALWNEIEREVVTPVVAAAYKKGPAVAASPGWHCRWCHFQGGCPEKKGSDANVEW